MHEERMSGAFLKLHLHDLPPYAVLHKFTAPDTGDPHSHPFAADSLILTGGYVEECFALDGTVTVEHRRPGDLVRIEAEKIHRIIELPEGECLTLFVPGPKVQEPGFFQFRDGVPYHRFWHEPDFRPYEPGR